MTTPTTIQEGTARDYTSRLRDPRWQKKRLHIMGLDNWRCVACGDSTSQLHVHHIDYGYHPWSVPDSSLQTLCDKCHSALGAHPKGGAFYNPTPDSEYQEMLASYKHCPICGCDEDDSHSGCVIFSCGHSPEPPSVMDTFGQCDSEQGYPSYPGSIIDNKASTLPMPTGKKEWI